MAKPAPGKSPLPAPVNIGVDGFDVVAVTLARGVATAAIVWSNFGVVVYVIRSVPKARGTVENGRLETEDALGKASRADAGADGFREARSKFPGLNTLRRNQISIDGLR
jgi:hypothetical protein